MKSKEHYKEWFLPSLINNPVWEEYIDAILEEIVTLQMYNMGTFNSGGFNGLAENITFDSEWVLSSVFNSTRGDIQLSDCNFALSNSILNHVSSISDVNSFAYLKYPFNLGKKYKISFEIFNVTDECILSISLGTSFENLSVSNGIKSIELLADDYFIYFKTAFDDHNASFSIRNIEVVGILSESDEKDRILTLKKIVNIEEASTSVLEKMVKSTNFPFIKNLPDLLYRQIVYNHSNLISYSGSELSSIILFYLLGYDAEYGYLYAHKGDYGSRNYGYILQKKEDLFESYTTVKTSAFFTYIIEVADDHQLIEGDKVANQTSSFTPEFVTVVYVDGNKISFDYPVTVTEDDVLDVYRKYPYAVNPDPENYFKTSHMDVYFKRKYQEGIDIDFAVLEQYLTKYLPVNVVIRFFGYRVPEIAEDFGLTELFGVGVNSTEILNFTDSLQYPVDNHTFVIATSDDRYSYIYVDTGVPGDPIGYVYIDNL